MKPADLKPGMVWGCWTVVGPASPEYRKSLRYVECVCWSCDLLYDVQALSIINGTSRRCKPCSLGRRRAMAAGKTPEAAELKAYRTKRAARLALIRQAAEARA